jgi:hypothetical protein
MKKVKKLMANTKFLFIAQFLVFFISHNIYSQTITERPIYKSCTYCRPALLTIENSKYGIWFSYQDSRYSSIVEIQSFTLETLHEAIQLMEKVLFILNMPKTHKDEQIIDTYKGVEIKRYGFNQIEAYVGNKGSFVIGKNNTIKVIKALKEYEKNNTD